MLYRECSIKAQRVATEYRKTTEAGEHRGLALSYASAPVLRTLSLSS